MSAPELGVVLGVLRVARGLSREELARTSGVSQSALSQYERGKKVPELQTLRRLVFAMDYPLSAIERAQALIASLEGEGAPPWTRPADRTSATPAGTDEIETISREVGRSATEIARAFLYFMRRSGLPPAAASPRLPEESAD